MDHLNEDFHVIQSNEDKNEFKRAYLNSYDHIFKGLNQTPIEVSLKYDKVKLITKNLQNDGLIQIKFVKEVLTQTNYIDLRSLNFNRMRSNLLDSDINKIYDYNIIISSNETYNDIPSKGYAFMNYSNFLSKLEEFDSNNLTEISLQNYSIFNQEFTKYYQSKINTSIKIKKILQTVLDSQYSKVNLRNYLKESEIQNILNYIDEIKALLLYLDDSNVISEVNMDVLINKLEEKVSVLNDYVSSYQINTSLSNIIFFYIIYIAIIVGFLGYLSSTTIREFAEYYRKKIL